jgi:hypothetical protein
MVDPLFPEGYNLLDALERGIRRDDAAPVINPFLTGSRVHPTPSSCTTLRVEQLQRTSDLRQLELAAVAA